MLCAPFWAVFYHKPVKPTPISSKIPHQNAISTKPFHKPLGFFCGMVQFMPLLVKAIVKSIKRLTYLVSYNGNFYVFQY